MTQLTTKVVHCKSRLFLTTPDYEKVYIGRPSKWGNPFVAGQDGTRQQVIDKYSDWILTQTDLLNSLQELEGKLLGCWCDPQPCHGSILIELLEG